MKKIFKMLIITVFITILSGCLQAVENNPNIIINEICSSNKSTCPTEDFKYLDWVELYNPTDEDVYLRRYSLSDEKSDLKKYNLPSVTIKAKGYLIVYFDSSLKKSDGLIADFGLSQEGETLYLSMPNGKTIDEVTFPALETDVTYGRYKSGFGILNPSPNACNEDVPLYSHVDNPIFSKPGGYYSNSFELELYSSTKADIYYTLDSSTPDESSLKYEEGIKIYNPSGNPNILKSRNDTSSSQYSYKDPVSKALVVRAVAIDEDGNKSDVITQTYIVGLSKYKTGKVVSLVTDNYNLTDPDTGIYIRGREYEEYVKNGSVGAAPKYNWEQSGREWERECNFTLLDSGETVFSQDCGMRIHGYGGRANIIKSFNIYARSSYGEKYFIDPIFDVEYTKSLVLKYDRYSNSSEKYRDGFLQSLMEDTNVGYQNYEMCTLFLNGEYWQTYMIMEKYSDDSISEEYNVDKDDVVIIKENKLDTGTDDDYASYRELLSFAKNTDFTKAKSYSKLEELIDIDSFIDFYITQLYYNHFDFSYKKNVFVWKTRTKKDDEYGDGRWRWMLYDFDYAAVNKDVKKDEKVVRYDFATNPFTVEYLFATDFKNDAFFHSFMRNEQFKYEFITRFLDLANTNYNAYNIKNKIKEEYGYLNTTLNTFFDNRLGYMLEYVAEYAKISKEVVEVSVFTEKDIKFNTLILNENFKGVYYVDNYITLCTYDEKAVFNDLEVVSYLNGVYTLKIIGDEPTITIS